MTKFDITPKLETLINDSNLSTQEKNNLLMEKTISHVNLKNFYMRCRPTLSLYHLLQTTKLNAPNKNKMNSDIPKTKEFLKSMELLRLKASEEEYRQLVKPKQQFTSLYDNEDEDFNPAQAHKEIKSHITTIFNILISVVSVAYAIWYWTDTSWKIKDSYRVLLCLFFGLLTLAAEVVVYMSYLNKIDDAKIKERNKKEVKSVVRSVTLN